MPEDLEASAIELCDANASILARKFVKLNLKRADVWPGDKGGLKIFALISVSGEDPAFVKHVIAKFMEGFPDHLKQASSRYFTRDGFPPGISLQPTDWNAEVHPA
jgi:hypothetical protein